PSIRSSQLPASASVDIRHLAGRNVVPRRFHRRGTCRHLYLQEEGLEFLADCRSGLCRSARRAWSWPHRQLPQRRALRATVECPMGNDLPGRWAGATTPIAALRGVARGCGPVLHSALAVPEESCSRNGLLGAGGFLRAISISGGVCP